MLIPSIFAENLFDDWFDFPSVRNMDRQLYGRHFAREMKTDVHEHDDHYEVDIDLPGFQKDQIQLRRNAATELLCGRCAYGRRYYRKAGAWCVEPEYPEEGREKAS